MTRFKPGDQVFGYRGQNMGAYAEYVCMPEDGMLAIKPANLTYEEAAAVPYGAFTALSLLRRPTSSRGQKVLINGASGGIGSAAVQLAKSLWRRSDRGVQHAARGLCESRWARIRSSITRKKTSRATARPTMLIFDILGKSSFGRCKNSLKPNGIYLFASFKMKHLLQMLWTNIRRRPESHLRAVAAKKRKTSGFIKELIEAGKYKVIVDKRYPLEQAAEAHRYAEAGHKAGSVVITIA